MPRWPGGRSAWSAERLASGAYPRLAVSERTRQLAADLLARTDLSAALRRVVLDCDDDMARALAARDADFALFARLQPIS